MAQTEGRALVTGASRGLGRAIALELAARGFEVVATMRSPADGQDLPAQSGGRIQVAALDLDRLGEFEIPASLRILVNNAGIETDYLPAEHAPLTEWRRVFETNLFGLVELTQRAIPTLRQQVGSVICNVTSASILFPMPFYSAYRASKAAVSAYGESLAAELRPFGVRILEVLPGPIETDMLAGSDRLPEAATYESYRALAEWAYAGRKGAGTESTSAAVAASAVVDSILDETSPLQAGCDPMGRAMLEAAGGVASEALRRGVLSAMPLTPDGTKKQKD